MIKECPQCGYSFVEKKPQKHVHDWHIAWKELVSGRLEKIVYSCKCGQIKEEAELH